jgi:hypothetical protein
LWTFIYIFSVMLLTKKIYSVLFRVCERGRLVISFTWYWSAQWMRCHSLPRIPVRQQIPAHMFLMDSFIDRYITTFHLLLLAQICMSTLTLFIFFYKILLLFFSYKTNIITSSSEILDQLIDWYLNLEYMVWFLWKTKNLWKVDIIVRYSAGPPTIYKRMDTRNTLKI